MPTLVYFMQECRGEWVALSYLAGLAGNYGVFHLMGLMLVGGTKTLFFFAG